MCVIWHSMFPLLVLRMPLKPSLILICLITEIGKSGGAIAAIVVLTASSILTVAMFVESVINVNNNIPNSRRRVRLIVLMGIYPVRNKRERERERERGT